MNKLIHINVLMLLCGLGLPAQEVPRTPVEGQQPDGRRTPPGLTTVPSEVHDRAGMFSAEAVRSAGEVLEKIEKSMGVPVLIETVETLEGAAIDEAAARRARRSGTQGVFILIARKEAKLEVLASRRYDETLPRQARSAVRAAFLDAFRKHDFDEGLRKGLAAIDEQLALAKRQGKVPDAEAPIAGSGDRPMVIRNQARLTLEGARTIIAAAEAKAAAMNLKVNIAVVDDGGHLLSFDRMNGARPASGYTAITKATTAATFRVPSGPVPAGAANPDPLLNLSLQLAAQASGGKLTTLHGGIPVVVDDQVIGGVGVGGGTGEQDAQVARAGVQAVLDALAKQPAR